ncbi:uncharacterized protein LOC114355158 [Ostrinia furnacalis]|uniref:uncharacterized protein LOC114355158 n=1 Tax=Ostrinia furnacalis TaxID=93504 RepID=UPI00103F5141|nr:uncharacterized protein LOC114355158 [Ostrinia furnacalis]
MSGENEENPTFEWSEDRLEEIAFKELFPLSVTDILSVQKDIIKRFLDFYLGGRVQKGIGVDDLVFAVLSILPVSPYDEKKIWSDAMFTNGGMAFFLTPEEKNAFQSRSTNDSQEDVQSTGEPMESPYPESVDATEDPVSISNDTENIHLDDDDDDHDDDEKDFTIEDETTANRDKDNLSESSNEINNVYDDDDDDDDDDGNSNISEEPINENMEPEPQPFSPPIELPENIKFAQKPISKENKILTYGPVENAAFISCCHELLNRWDSESRSRAVLKSFFAVVALVLMRATTKGYKHLISTFYSQKFLRLLRHSIKCGLSKYSPPHKRCLKRAYRTFRRRDGNTPTMFAKLVLLSKNLSRFKYLNYIIFNGLLNYTAEYGFNLIQLLRTLCNEIEDGSVTRVMEATWCEATAASWMKVAIFLNERYTASSSDSSYKWARVLDGRFFKGLSCQQNYGLAVIMSIFVEKLTGNLDVWKATWVENDELEKYRELGSRLYERFIC